MKEVYPNLMVGNSSDAYNVLNTGLRDDISLVLDCTTDMPTKTWKRKDSEVKVRRVGFKADAVMTPAKLQKAVDTIHEYRRKHETVLVVSSGGKRAKAIALAYLLSREINMADSFKRVFSLADEKLTGEQYKAVLKFAKCFEETQEVGG